MYDPAGFASSLVTVGLWRAVNLFLRNLELDCVA